MRSEAKVFAWYFLHPTNPLSAAGMVCLQMDEEKLTAQARSHRQSRASSPAAQQLIHIGDEHRGRPAEHEEAGNAFQRAHDAPAMRKIL
jgi:hypothetical protein